MFFYYTAVLGVLGEYALIYNLTLRLDWIIAIIYLQFHFKIMCVKLK